MATALINKNAIGLMFSLFFLVVLATANPSSNNETTLMPTPYSVNETVLLGIEDPSSDNETDLVGIPCPIVETEPLNVTYASSDNETELLPTSRPCVVKETPQTSPYFNSVTVETECTNTSMLVYMNFTRPFRGVVYPKRNLSPLCSFFPLPSSNDTEVVLELPFNSCGTKFRSIEDIDVYIYNSIQIQQHQMIPTSFDLVRNVSCMLEGPSEAVRSSNFVPVRLPHRRAVPWLEVCAGSDLFPTDEFRPEGFIESALYIVVKVADRQVHRDMIVRNCIGHDRRFITNATKLYQMSNFYGCSDNSSMLADFAITNETGRFSDMMAFAMIRNFSMFARGQLYISCGVNLCKRSCQLNCDEDESERLRGFSSVVLKKMVMRASGATTPSTFRLFSDDGPQRIKRSVSEVFSDVLHASGSFLSNMMKGSDDSLSTTEAPTEEAPFISKLDSERNESTLEVEFEVNTPSIGIETTVTSEQTVLNQSMPSTSFNLRDSSAEMYSSERFLETTTVNKSTVHKRNFSGYALPNAAVAEVFVFAIFCLMTGSYICLVHSKVDKRKCAPTY